MVNRCTITGELLGPPNYHRYQEFLQRHYANRINGMPFDRFVSKVETVKDREAIDQWLESMKKGFRYVLKERAEGEPESFESLDAVRMFLLQHRKNKVVGSGESVRFAGREIERMPHGDLRRSVEAHIEQQRRFPLDSANNIRGRLRRHKFTVYKKGSKGISYVCAVKRKFRDGNTVFTNSIRELIEFIEANPNTPAAKLPKLFIGIGTEKQKPEKLKVSEEQIQAEKEALAQAYEREWRELRTTPEVMGGLEMAVRETLEHELRAFQAAIKANLDALEAGRRVLEGVVRRLGEHAASTRGTAPGYGARPASAEVVAVAFRQSV